MQNQKLSELLRKMEASKDSQSDEDQIVSINEELAKNIRAVYAGANNQCSNNMSCDNNDVCDGNSSCFGNGNCSSSGHGNETC